jgi:hypothetical protein
MKTICSRKSWWTIRNCLPQACYCVLHNQARSAYAALQACQLELPQNMLALPPAPSWFPGHMAAFAKALPSLLSKTHVVLEVRDARLPLTSINSLLEATLVEWLTGRHKTGGVRERIVVYTKRDLVPSWGEEVGEIIRATPCPAKFCANIIASSKSSGETFQPSSSFYRSIISSLRSSPSFQSRMSV